MTNPGQPPDESNEEQGLDLTADAPASGSPLETPYRHLSGPMHRERLRGRVFYTSVWALILYIAASFVVVVANWATIDTMQRLASFLLPPLTALTATAAAFYYTNSEGKG